MKETVHKQFDSDRRGYQADPRGGTPYHSEAGNPGNAMRHVARGTNLESADHGNQNNPHSNGPGVMLDDGAEEYQRGYQPRGEATMDSPVPRHAPVFDTGTIHEEDRAHAGLRNEHTATDNILSIGGVLSRGMRGTSKASDHNELELVDDDVLRGVQQETHRPEKE